MLSSFFCINRIDLFLVGNSIAKKENESDKVLIYKSTNLFSKGASLPERMFRELLIMRYFPHENVCFFHSFF